jgi:toxin-antitoxin system PIN domain toxin
MLVDANLLLYAVDDSSKAHEAAAGWLERALNGDRRVGLPWQTIGAFLRISTHPRIMGQPLSATEAWTYVDAWLAAGPSWIPPESERTAAILGRLVINTPATGNLVTDALLGALAIEHGLVVQTADTDFGRFADVRWNNPIADR